MMFLPVLSPCLLCVLENAPPPGSSPTCDTAGVILPIISMIASLQTAEAIKILTGNFERLHGGLIQIDIWQGTHSKLNLAGLRERANCRCCRDHLFDYLNAGARQLTTTLCGRNSVQIVPGDKFKIDLGALA